MKPSLFSSTLRLFIMSVAWAALALSPAHAAAAEQRGEGGRRRARRARLGGAEVVARLGELLGHRREARAALVERVEQRGARPLVLAQRRLLRPQWAHAVMR